VGVFFVDLFMQKILPGQVSQLHSTRLRTDVNTQVALPVEVPVDELIRKPSLGASITMCMELAGFDLDKEVPIPDIDKGQFSRWKNGTEGIKWPKLVGVMDGCGNDAPVLWMLHQRGWDLHSLRRRESETERENRLLKEQLQTVQAERLVERRLLAELLTGRPSN
jgi:hypothetical protein